MVETNKEIRVADEAWVALAQLHRRHPERESFSAIEILDSAKREKAHPEWRTGLQPHIHLHNVAGAPPNSAQYRMFTKTATRTYRLFRPGDECHPGRKGKTAPKREELPPEYHALLDWYEREYCRRPTLSSDDDDPVLQMWGIGKEIWTDEGGDVFITRERAAFNEEAEGAASPSPDTIGERVWKRIVSHQGSVFYTATKLPFTHSVAGHHGLWFYRDGNRINQILSRREIEKAVSLCPVHQTTELKNFRNYAYLFGLLTDPRISGTDW